MDVGTRLSTDDSNLFESPTLYHSTIGALQYLTLTRPDISFTVNRCSQFLQAPTELQWQACKRVLRYVKGTHYGLQFKLASSLNIECYADADWGSNVEDRRSTSGYCGYLGPNLIQWSSRKQKVVALSSTEAEYRALAQTATEVAWLQSMFTELSLHFPSKPVIWCDNTSAGALASNPVFHARTKHIEIDAHYIREQVLAKNLTVQYAPSKLQIADVLTKALSVVQFTELR
ncbi:secreted RxLR effector protein 161-like [Pistacia vera]|uniref:secreted RxLR effector protein 161-like n=1 Tax=Pistacia vera TaxID=55513 RepID=UPI001262F725|nr:secreted RxLR effector protein 161-like [Pistacia vera]